MTAMIDFLERRGGRKTVLKTALSIVALIAPLAANSGTIGPGDFYGHQIIEDYESYTSIVHLSGPVDLGGDIYTSGAGTFVLGVSPGNGTRAIFTQSDLTYADIVFSTSVNRFGLELSTEQDWELVTISAFSSSDALLGQVNASGLGYEPVFAGFESESESIAWIRVEDQSANGNTISIDNLTKEFYLSAVPLPASAWLFGSALLGLICYSRRKGAKSNA